MKQQPLYCDGMIRRDFLRIGATSLLGMQFGLTGLLAQQARAAKTAATARDVSLIFVFLKGGMSTIDTFDLKPDAPSEIRGEFNSISTRIPGVRISEHLPKIAGNLDKFSLIRSFTHHNSDHGPADHYMLTGYFPTAGFNPNLKPNNQHPSFGSVIAQKLGPRGAAPPYVCLPMMHASAGSAFLGPAAVPFVIEADPSAAGFSVPDLAPPMVLDAERLSARRELLTQMDQYQRRAEVTANHAARTVSVFGQKAFTLMTSPDARRAFDIAAEPEKLRDAYGRHTLGQSCLMARRLVEAGVRCVTIEHSNWDTHNDNFTVLKSQLLPKFDEAISTLFRDLAERGMLESTLVIVSGEFGRTPRINKDAGRDHWGKCFTVALGGGGIQGGRVVGKSDAWAQEPAENPYGPEDLAVTLYHLLGINTTEELRTPEGRPVAITKGGRIIKELV